MSDEQNQSLTGVQKAAILLMFLRKEVAAQMLRMLSKEEVQRVGIAMAELDRPTKPKIEAVVRDFIEDLHGTSLFHHSGPDFVQSILPDLLDDERRTDIMPLIARRVNKDFEIFITNRQPGAVAALLKEEQPQVQAVALALMGPINAARVLKFMDPHRQGDVTIRMSRLRQIPGDLADDVMNAIRDALGSVDDYVEVGGLENTARILAKMSDEDRRPILDAVDDEEPDLSENLRKNMVKIEDLIRVPVEILVSFKEDLGQELITTALNGASDDLVDHFMGIFSSKMRDEIRENIGMRIPKDEVEKAQLDLIASVMKRADEEHIPGLGYGREA
jgi:flagellar motor switch protein FliG